MTLKTLPPLERRRPHAQLWQALFGGPAVAAACAILALSGCSGVARLPVSAGTGPAPVLPATRTTLLPVVHVATAHGWSVDSQPTAAAGLRVSAFARDLDHPRWLYVLPNGDVLVAETNAPARADNAVGIKGWLMGLLMKRGGAGVASANRITLLRDTDGDGVADLRTVLVQGLNSPFGMALIGDELYVANTDAVLRFPYAAARRGLHRQVSRFSACLPAPSITTGPRT